MTPQESLTARGPRHSNPAIRTRFLPDRIAHARVKNRSARETSVRDGEHVGVWNSSSAFKRRGFLNCVRNIASSRRTSPELKLHNVGFDPVFHAVS